MPTWGESECGRCVEDKERAKKIKRLGSEDGLEPQVALGHYAPPKLWEEIVAGEQDSTGFAAYHANQRYNFPVISDEFFPLGTRVMNPRIKSRFNPTGKVARGEYFCCFHFESRYKEKKKQQCVWAQASRGRAFMQEKREAAGAVAA